MNNLDKLNKDLQETLERMKSLQKTQREALDKLQSVRSEVEKNEYSTSSKRNN